MDTSALQDPTNINEITNINDGEFSDFMLRFGIDIIAIFLLVRFIYYIKYRNRDYEFTFFMFNVLIFLICYLLNNTKMKVGIAFGLFAVFSILRYRTVTVPIREMGYLFASVALGTINSLTDYNAHLYEIVLSNGIILSMISILDRKHIPNTEAERIVIYDQMHLLHPDKKNELIKDLISKTGLQISRVKVERYDLIKNNARIRIFYPGTDKDLRQEVVEDDDED